MPSSSPAALASRTCRSEEHTSELQSPCNLVCRLRLESTRRQRRADRIHLHWRTHHEPHPSTLTPARILQAARTAALIASAPSKEHVAVFFFLQKRNPHPIPPAPVDVDAAA